MNEICKRPGCGRRRHDPRRDGCSPICGVIVRFQREAENLHRVLGPSPATTAYVDSTHDLGSTLDATFRARAVIRRSSIETGMSGDDWSKLIRGEYTVSENSE